MIRLSSALACVVLALATLVPAHAATDDFQEARRLHAQGSLASAMDKVDAILARQPRDARARFLKGVILSEQGKQPDAIKIFTALTEDFPELPEPYNNLAVLYAAQGQDDKARRALETAIRTHPSYATAHENLGDIYAKMAREAYDKALQLDSNNSSARAKLAMVKDLFSQRPGSAQPLVKSAVADPPVPPVPSTTPSASASPAPQPSAPAAGSPPPAGSKPPAPSVDNAPVLKPTATDKEPPGRETADPQADVLRALQAWAKAWSAGDIKQYLGFYAPGFRPPGGQSRADWEQSRRDRVGKGKRITVQVQGPKVTFARPEEAVVTFRQLYQSESLKTSGRKRVTMIRANGRWLIQQEEVVR
ncbi:MAG: tetratricopeptide repeat protein [Betaproteobacteria bacterium]|nr:tetratricopeptide repeat protein [Betaproteobacteria bacterium]